MNKSEGKVTVNIPSNGTVDFDLRQPNGEIDNKHATLLGTTFAAIMVNDAHPAFVKAVYDRLNEDLPRIVSNLHKTRNG